MNKHSCAWILTFTLFSIPSHAENLTRAIKKAVERSTLDQPGTKPFHLRATIAPSFDRDKDSGRNGSVEIWWQSPTRWRREVQSPEFHQIEIVDGERNWQKNDGEFFPEWLRQTAIELIKPVPPLDEVLEHTKSTEVRNIPNPINPAYSQLAVDWVTDTGTPGVHNVARSYVALQESTGLLLYAGGLGWGGGFKDYAGFHGLMVARTVSVGSPEVTAKVTVFGDLGQVAPEFFDATAPGSDPLPLRTVLIDESMVRKTLQPESPQPWPPLQDGPLRGNVTTVIIVDRQGKVRDLGPVVSENSAINEAGRQRILGMRFTPFVQNGVPIQVVSQITVPFKTVRPAGAESCGSARAYFERGRKLSFLAAGSDKSYVLRAEFQAKSSQGTVDMGHYEDTWMSNTEWKREAAFGESRYMRSRSGDKRYELAEGADVGVLRFVLQTMEPIPAIDTFVESDWRIKRDIVNGEDAIRVLAGYESPEGKLDPERARGYWFDESGVLVKTYLHGIESRWLDFQDYSGLKVPRQIDVLKDEKLAMRMRIVEIAPADSIAASSFVLKGHERKRAFTAEER
jgi:hypothetical protein